MATDPRLRSALAPRVGFIPSYELGRFGPVVPLTVPHQSPPDSGGVRYTVPASSPGRYLFTMAMARFLDWFCIRGAVRWM